MKSLKTVFFMGAATLLFAACNNDDEVLSTAPNEEGNLTVANFDMDVSHLNMGIAARGIVPIYANAGFTIYAFKHNGADYICNKVINGSTMTYNSVNQKLTGTTSLPIGVYRFVPAYGLANSANITLNGDMLGKPLTDNLLMSHTSTGMLPEIFLMDGAVADLADYSMGLTNEVNPTVTATIKRAVARVDVMFIKATKSGGVYTEQAMSSGNVLKGTLANLDLKFTNLNTDMNFFGLRSGNGTFGYTFFLDNLDNRITIGDNDTKTAIGEPTYFSFDNVAPEHVIKGSAHVSGTYLIPNNDGAKSVGLTLDVTHPDNTKRTISISVDDDHLLALERNKVTLVKVYVLGESVFDTNATFEIDIDTVWLGSNVVEGETN